MFYMMLLLLLAARRALPGRVLVSLSCCCECARAFGLNLEDEKGSRIFYTTEEGMMGKADPARMHAGPAREVIPLLAGLLFSSMKAVGFEAFCKPLALIVSSLCFFIFLFVFCCSSFVCCAGWEVFANTRFFCVCASSLVATLLHY